MEKVLDVEKVNETIQKVTKLYADLTVAEAIQVTLSLNYSLKSMYPNVYKALSSVKARPVDGPDDFGLLVGVPDGGGDDADGQHDERDEQHDGEER